MKVSPTSVSGKLEFNAKLIARLRNVSLQIVPKEFSDETNKVVTVATCSYKHLIIALKLLKLH